VNPLSGLHQLLGKIGPQQPGANRGLNVNPDTVQGVHSPQQTQQAIEGSLPMGYSPAPGGANPYQGYISPHPFLAQLMNLSLNQRIGNAFNSLPTAPNHGGALPPQMVNVAWSPHPVPYAQSLTPPAGYKP
jgi:hypothetical protein